MILFSPSAPKRDEVLLTSVTTGTARTACTTGCWTATTREVVLVCCWDPKESATVVLMKGVNWEMILATRSESVLFGAGAGLGAGFGTTTAFLTSTTGLDLMETNPC